MTPVFPYLVRRSEDGWRGELLLRLRNGKSAYVVHLSLEQARMLAVEMRGLATDHCPLHHLAVRMAEGLHAKISHIVIQRPGPGDEVVGILRLVTAAGLHSISVDAAAGLAMAIHMGIPIFMDGEFSSAEPEPADRQELPAQTEAGPEFGAGLATADPDLEPGFRTPIPQAFQELIDGLKMPDDHDGLEGRPSPGEAG